MALGLYGLFKGGEKSGIVDALFGGGEEAANRQRRSLGYGAADRLNSANVLAGAQDLMQGSAPFINALLAQADLGAQTGAQGIQAGLARAGLGNTGLGAALSGGLRAGAALQGNALRARMWQDFLNQSLQQQMGKASALSGVQIQAAPSAWGNLFRTAADATANYLGAKG